MFLLSAALWITIPQRVQAVAWPNCYNGGLSWLFLILLFSIFHHARSGARSLSLSLPPCLCLPTNSCRTLSKIAQYFSLRTVTVASLQKVTWNTGIPLAVKGPYSLTEYLRIRRVLIQTLKLLYRSKIYVCRKGLSFWLRCKTNISLHIFRLWDQRHPEDGGNVFLWNRCTFLPHRGMSDTERQYLLCKDVWCPSSKFLGYVAVIMNVP